MKIIVNHKACLIRSVVIFFVGIAGGYTQELPNNDELIPTINNHRFIGSNFIRNPFINTSFNISMGFANTQKIAYPLLDSGDTLFFGIDSELLFLNGDVQYRQKIKDWLAMHIELGYAARLGTDGGSIFFQGINTLSDFKIGWLFKLVRSERMLISGSVEVRNNEAVFISIGKLLEDLIMNNPNPSLTKTVPALNVGMGAELAYGINDMWGILADVKIGYGETLERGNARLVYQAGVSLDFDLYGRTDVPIGSVLTIITSNLPEFVWSEDRQIESISWKIAYTGSEDFNMGLEFFEARIPLEGLSDKATTRGAVLAFRYYFN